MYKIKAAIYNFMAGRYGTDDLNKFIFCVYFAFIIVNFIFKITIINALIFALFFIYLFRSFSKNIYNRQIENRKYLIIKNKIFAFFKLKKNRWKERKTHVYRRCKHCRAIVRLPRKRGKHVVCCPKCKKDFNVRVL